MSNIILTNQDGENTSLEMVQPQGRLTPDALEAIRDRIETALNATSSEMEDVTPQYWEARQGEEKIMVFVGWKPINKKDEAGTVIGKDFASIFHDGSREIVCNQIALKGAMLNMNQGDTFRIKCTLAVAKQAKKFEILKLK